MPRADRDAVVCHLVAQVATVGIERRPARTGEVLRNCARIDRARQVLGFDPTTSLDQGLRATWDWFRQGP